MLVVAVYNRNPKDLGGLEPDQLQDMIRAAALKTPRFAQASIEVISKPGATGLTEVVCDDEPPDLEWDQELEVAFEALVDSVLFPAAA